MTPPRRNSWSAALLALCAMQMLPLGDGIAKHLSAGYPVLQLVWARFFFHFVFSAPPALVRFSPAAFRVPHPVVQLRRGAFLAAATLMFFSSLRHLPLADAIALLFTSPILLVLLSRLTLGERVGGGRWLAVTVGFVAVLLIVRPGFASFHWSSLPVDVDRHRADCRHRRLSHPARPPAVKSIRNPLNFFLAQLPNLFYNPKITVCGVEQSGSSSGS